MVDNVQVDVIQREGGSLHPYGQTAAQLISSGFSTNAMRPYFGNDGRPYVTRIVNGKPMAVPTMNATLRKEEWKQYDTAIFKAFQQRLVGIADLMGAGLVFRLNNGMGTTVLEYEDMSEAGEAKLSMDGVAKGADDTPEFDMNYLPLPICHADFSINARFLAASRKNGQPLDTTLAEENARRIAEKLETMLFTGTSAFSYGGGIIRGYLDFPSRNTGTLGTNWDASAATGTTIVDQVRAMKQKSINDRNYGPWVLYIPTAYETIMDDDFKAESDKTIRQRILEIGGISKVQVADYLTANNLLLVQLQSSTIRLVVGMDITMVEWTTHGGLRHHYKIMTIMVPQPRADQNGRCGIVHYS